MKMRTLCAIAAFAIVASFTSIASAQDAATPEPMDQEPVTVYAVDGTVTGAISVSEVVDPFGLYAPNYPPARSHRYIAVTYDIENTGQRPWSFNPGHLYIVDSEGYAAGGSSINMTEDSTIAILSSQDIAIGATLTGSVIYQVPVGIAANRLIYWPANDRQITVARLAGAGPELGTPVDVVGTDGTVTATITVDAFENPFAGYEENAPPERGSNYVLVTISVENPGPRPMNLNPGSFLLVDIDGFVTRPTTIRRGEAPPPDLQSINPFTPGESTQGGVGYLVLSGVPIVSVIYAPSNTMLLEVAAVDNDRPQRS